MHALISNSPILMVAAAVAAFLISTLVVALGRAVFRLVAISLQAAVIMAAFRLMVVLAPVVLVVLLLSAAYLHH